MRYLFYPGKRGGFISRAENGKIILSREVSAPGVYHIEHLEERERYYIARGVRPVRYVIIEINRQKEAVIKEGRMVVKTILSNPDVVKPNHYIRVGKKEEDRYSYWIAEQTVSTVTAVVPLTGGLTEEQLEYLRRNWDQLVEAGLELNGDRVCINLPQGLPQLILTGYWYLFNDISHYGNLVSLRIYQEEHYSITYDYSKVIRLWDRNYEIYIEKSEFERLCAENGIQTPYLPEVESEYWKAYRKWEMEYEPWKKRFLRELYMDNEPEPVEIEYDGEIRKLQFGTRLQFDGYLTKEDMMDTEAAKEFTLRPEVVDLIWKMERVILVKRDPWGDLHYEAVPEEGFRKWIQTLKQRLEVDPEPKAPAPPTEVRKKLYWEVII